MPKQYRPGAIGALADEYERMLAELKELVRTIPPERFTVSTVPLELDDFRTHAGIVLHVLGSGYLYADHIRKRFNEPVVAHAYAVGSPEEAVAELDRMFGYTLLTFEGKWGFTDERMLSTLIRTSWTTYDLEALIEHAIVHVMRHRLQLEKLITRTGADQPG